LSQSKDRAAAELFAALYADLAGWCRRLVDDDGTAHEIASEAFTRLWLRWSNVEEPRGFLYVTAANLVRDHWRRTGGPSSCCTTSPTCRSGTSRS
jgi:RNA polymerase sigma-70 factor (ECF subfamily)